jgi:hypothetical protein
VSNAPQLTQNDHHADALTDADDVGSPHGGRYSLAERASPGADRDEIMAVRADHPDIPLVRVTCRFRSEAGATPRCLQRMTDVPQLCSPSAWINFG